MAWKLRLCEAPGSTTTAKPGDCWYAPWHTEDISDPRGHPYLSPEYFRDWYGKRAPIVVVLPHGGEWLIDSLAWDDDKKCFKDHGWTVAGEVPNLTISPSINVKGFYHGWLKNGELTDDCEGRKFDV